MLYLSIGLFVLAFVAAMFVFLLTVSAPVVALAETLGAAFLCASLLAFAIDRAWGAFALRRASRMPPQAQLDLERAEGEGMIAHRPWSTRTR